MKKMFVIETKNTHYALGVGDDGLLRHIHYGKKADGYEAVITRECNSNHAALDYAKMEYTPFGGTMYRNCAFKCEYPDGCRDSVFKLVDSKQDENSLVVNMYDDAYDVALDLEYKFSKDTDVIARRAIITNKASGKLKLNKIMSGELNLPSHKPYYAINFNGSWGGEFKQEDTLVKNGTLVYESRKGTAGHTNSPCVILHQNANEDMGDVFFAALAYGGSFKVEVQRDFAGVTRAMLGISDFDFSYDLNSDESFEAPWLYFGFANGFANMSNMMNKYAVDNILPRQFADKPLPVLYNSWEATWFDVNAEGQLKLAKIAKDIGCELFVMDDGWFGQRKDDWAGLGDWYVNKEKFPNGLGELVDGVNELGMDFGLWFEPEMVQKDSDLFRAHPDWTYHYDTREASELRHQLVLNLTMPEVQQYVFDCMDKMLEEYNIRYIKWDMNRPFSEIGCANLVNQQELWYRHTMAVYDVCDRLKEKYPYLQIEACSSGGGRAEYGALSHFDMVWTSDNTDAVDRLDIQRGYSMLYPIKCMRAWVTDSNAGARPVSLDYRFNVSMQGSLSIGANLLKYSDEEIQKSKEYIALYKEIRDIVQFGDFYRIANFKDDDFYATQYVSRDKSESVLFICSNANNFFNTQFKSYRLKGLDENKIYVIDDKEYSGAALMNIDTEIRLHTPLEGRIVRIIAK